MKYLLYLPLDYDATDEAWPLLVFLHGMGERGPDLNQVKMHGPAKLIEQGRQFPFVVVSPQCPASRQWVDETTRILDLIDRLVDTYRIDERRIYMTGLSMGGSGTWSIAEAFPDRFAAIAPICGDGDPLRASRMKNLPVWAFHGYSDPVVPWSNSKNMVDAVNLAGGNAKLTIYPDAGHDSWSQTYENEALYEWFLSCTN